MSLTLGSAPFGHVPGGRFNFEPARQADLLYFEDSPRRVRGRFAGETVVDSRRVKLLHEHGRLPVWHFPLEDVRMDLLEPAGRRPDSEHKGDAEWWTLRAGGRTVEDAAWSHPQPPPGAPPLAGHVAFRWDAMDTWLEESEEVFVHPRDPYHRVDVLDTDRHVRVSLEGELLAESRSARVLFETGLPPRWYLPLEDLDGERLEPHDAHTACPYKGHAEYRSVRVGGRLELALVWTYREPLREVEPIAGRWCFFDERVDLEVDGERGERPRTAWSTTDWLNR
jgi:uncharacterized protein (DUF427 family)